MYKGEEVEDVMKKVHDVTNEIEQQLLDCELDDEFKTVLDAILALRASGNFEN